MSINLPEVALREVFRHLPEELLLHRAGVLRLLVLVAVLHHQVCLRLQYRQSRLDLLQGLGQVLAVRQGLVDLLVRLEERLLPQVEQQQVEEGLPLLLAELPLF
jgi:hypothetical protein